MISKQQVTSFHHHRSPSSTPSAASRQAWDSQPDDSPIKNHVDKITFCPIIPFLFLFVRSAKMIDLFCLCEYVDQLLCVFAVLLSKESVRGAGVAFATSSTDSEGKHLYWLRTLKRLLHKKIIRQLSEILAKKTCECNLLQRQGSHS